MDRTALTQAKARLPEIVERYLAGESMQVLASETGVHRQRLYEWMLAGIGDQSYHDAVTAVLVRRISEADLALEDKAVEPDTARAQARARFARMDLERRRPHLYGQRIETNAAPSITVNVVSYPRDDVTQKGTVRESVFTSNYPDKSERCEEATILQACEAGGGSDNPTPTPGAADGSIRPGG